MTEPLFARILVPLDGSATAEAVLPQIRRLLLRADAELLAFRAEDLTGTPMLVYAPHKDDLFRRADEYLAAVAGPLREAGARIRKIVREGQPAAAIVQAADHEKATLIAMSTHGRSGLARWTLGSVTERVVRTSPVPVLVLRSFEPGARPVPRTERAFRKVLVAVDGSACSFEALPAAASFARTFGSKVVAVIVEEPEIDPKIAGGTPKELLDRAVAALNELGVKADAVVLKGDPASELVDACLRLEAEALVMSTHGRSGLARWMMGSVTEKVLRAAPVPLLVVRSRQTR